MGIWIGQLIVNLKLGCNDSQLYINTKFYRL